MIHRHRLLLAIAVVWSTLAGTAFGQKALSDLLNAPSIDAEGRAAIEAHIKTFCAQLKDPDPAKVSKAREELVNKVRVPMGQPGAAFAAVYSEIVSVQLLAILDHANEFRARLNAAVAAARIAEAVRNTRMENVAINLLDQRQGEHLNLWGVRTARYVLPELAKIRMHGRLLAAVTAAFQRNPNGAMTEEAYSALTASTDPRVVAEFVKPLLEMMQQRLKLYGNGIPEDPERDFIPSAFLTQQGVWDKGLNKDQRTAARDIMCQLLTSAAKHGDVPMSKEREQVVPVINKTAQGIAVAAQIMGQTDLAGIAINTAKSAENPAIKLSGPVQQLVDAIKANPGFVR